MHTHFLYTFLVVMTTGILLGSEQGFTFLFQGDPQEIIQSLLMGKSSGETQKTAAATLLGSVQM